MSLLNDIYFLKQIPLLKFKEVNQKFTFRCPICGDSKKNDDKVRGFSERHKKYDRLFVYCHNCNYARSFKFFLNDLCDLGIINKSVLIDYKKCNILKKENTESFCVTEKEYREHKGKYTLENGLIKSVNKLNNKVVNEYLKNRHIDDSYFSDIYVTNNFKKLVNTYFIENKYKSERDYSRIVFPIYDKSELIGLQGRAINDINPYKYLTIKLKEEYTLCYIPKNLNFDETVYLTEGIFDCLTIKNGCAMLKSMIDIDFIRNKFKKAAFIFDNEKRNVPIFNNYKKIAEMNDFGLFIWPKNILSKDLNELAGIMNRDEIDNMIKKNTHYGVMKKKLKLGEWRS